MFQNTQKLYMTDKVIENLNRILSLPSIYVCAESNILRYIGFVQNEVNPWYIKTVHYFIGKNKLRRLCCGDENSIINGRGKNLYYELHLDYDLTPISNTEKLIQTNLFTLYYPEDTKDCHPFDNPYDFVEDVLINNGYKKDFRAPFYE